VAMQLACYMGFDDIVLLGTDLTPDKEGRGHFWSQDAQEAPFLGDVEYQIRCFEYAAQVLRKEARVRVVSEACPLTCWPKVSFEEALNA